MAVKYSILSDIGGDIIIPYAPSRIIEVTSTAPILTLTEGYVYVCVNPITSLSFSLSSSAVLGYEAQYRVIFTTDSAGCNVTWPSTLIYPGIAAGNTPTINADTTYEINIADNRCIVASFGVAETFNGVTDVQINNNSVVSSNIANIVTISTYDPSSNKLATQSDLPSVPAISTDVVADKTSNSKTASPAAVYSEIHPTLYGYIPASGFVPNIVYNVNNGQTITGTQTLNLASPTDSTIVNHYYFMFNTGSTVPTINWPSAITSWKGGSAPTINANKHYEISVLNGVATFMEV